MSDDVDDANHEAKKDANSHIDKAEDGLEQVGKDDVDKAQLPAGPTDEARLQKFKDEIEAQFDQIQQDINANRIIAADAKLRALRDRLRLVLREGPKKTNILKELKDIRKAKRRITLPAIAAAPGGERRGGLAMRNRPGGGRRGRAA